MNKTCSPYRFWMGHARNCWLIGFNMRWPSKCLVSFGEAVSTLGHVGSCWLINPAKFSSKHQLSNTNAELTSCRVMALYIPSSPNHFCMLLDVENSRIEYCWQKLTFPTVSYMSWFLKPWLPTACRHATSTILGPSFFFVQLGGRRSQPTDHSIKQIVQQEHLSLSDGWMIVLLGGW